MPEASDQAAAVFDPLRPTLVRVAYRMLGTVSDAEDVVQDAFVRWLDADRGAIREPAAFLRRVVTRLCLDRLKGVRKRREAYVGQWLPEPIVRAADDDADDVTLPLLLALERLSPLERAAFLLHDVFGLSFEEIAASIDRDPAACRRLASRARDHVRADRPRYPVSAESGLAIARAFFAASREGDMDRLRNLLAEEVTLYADGGGKAPARKEPAIGTNEVVGLLSKFAAVYAKTPSRLIRYGLVNGLPGFVTIERGDVLQTTAIEIERGRIIALYVVRNPDKLQHVRETVH